MNEWSQSGKRHLSPKHEHAACNRNGKCLTLHELLQIASNIRIQGYQHTPHEVYVCLVSILAAFIGIKPMRLYLLSGIFGPMLLEAIRQSDATDKL